MTLSDYELLVLKKLKKGKKDSREIAAELGLPEPVVRAAMERVKDVKLDERKAIDFSVDSLKLLIDIIIVYVVIELIIALLGWWI